MNNNIEKKKKPFYKKWWFWLIVIVVAISSIEDEDEKTGKKNLAQKQDTEVVEKNSEKPKKKEVEDKDNSKVAAKPKEKSENKTEKPKKKEVKDKDMPKAPPKPKEESEEKEVAHAFDRDYFNKSQLRHDDLMRNPDKHMAEPVSFSGRILQVIKQDSLETQFLMLINNDIKQVAFVSIDTYLLDSRILVDDNIRAYGFVMGTQNYTTALGVNKEVPLIYGEILDIK